MQHQQEESVREVEQIRHMNDTIQQVQQESQSNTYRAQTEASDIRIVTPHYKTADKPGSDIKLGSTAAELNAKFAETNGDYKAERSQEHFRMQIIDPKVNDNAYLPAHAPREFARKKLMEDFPSLHGKRSFLNLDAMDQRRIRAREEHVNIPWNKPGWPGPKKDDSHLRELEKLRESIDTLQKNTLRRSRSLGQLPPPEELIFVKEVRLPKLNPSNNASKTNKLSNGTPTEKMSGTRNGTTGKDRLGRDPGYLVRIRKNRYLARASQANATHRRLQKEPGRLRLIENRKAKSESNLAYNSRDDYFHSRTYESEEEEFMSSKQHSRSDLPINGVATKIKDSKNGITLSDKQREYIRTEERNSQSHIHAREYELSNYRRTDTIRREKFVKTAQVPRTTTRYPKAALPYTAGMSSPGSNSYKTPQDIGSRDSPRSILKQNYNYRQQYAGPGEYWEDNAQVGLTEGRTLPVTDPAQMRQYSPQLIHERYQRRANTERLDDPEFQRQLQHNLQLHREYKPTPSDASRRAYPAVPFKGPFFQLEEIGAAPPMASTSVYDQYSRTYNSVEHIPAEPRGPVDDNDREGTVVIWPPLEHDEKRKRTHSAPLVKNVRDPDRIYEYQKQKQMELEAIQQKEAADMILWEKQAKAAKIQQEELIRRQIESGPTLVASQTPLSTPKGSLAQFPYPGLQTTTHSSPNLRVYEARPISALSDDLSLPKNVASPSVSTWKRTYTVEDESQKETLKNEILTSDEILEKERFEIDLLKRRETFVEKVDKPPEIQKLGKRWQPPPEKPYIWPHLQKPVTIQTDNLGGMPEQTINGEYRWTPVVRQPDFKREQKNFTPTHSPPDSPRRNGVGTLDEASKRQTRYVIQPSPDGSHRPKPMFRQGRDTPAGGFFPHAPNSLKVVKKRNTQILDSLSPNSINEERSDVQIIHKLEYHLPGEGSYFNHASPSPTWRRERSSEVEDWEKIYDLPPHSSTLTDRARSAVPKVDIRRRMRVFEQDRDYTNDRWRSASGPSSAPPHLGRPVSASERSPSAQRSLDRIQLSTQASPAPASYSTARKYVPAPLPPGYRQPRDGQRGSESELLKVKETVNTKRLAKVVQDAAAMHQHHKEPLAAHKLATSPRPQSTRPTSSASVHFSENQRFPTYEQREGRSQSEFLSNRPAPSRSQTRSQPMHSEGRPGTQAYRSSSRTVEQHNYRR
ncbi:protein pat-12 [Ditylenchus destructor]|nr:protein pat-12 [Ditylenchus destructor]